MSEPQDAHFNIPGHPPAIKRPKRELPPLVEMTEQQVGQLKQSLRFGPSYDCPACHVKNNPNNSICWHCATRL